MPPPPRHRLIRDAVEAEEIAVEWLRWVGVDDARRLGTAEPTGISGSGMRAVAAFDPLPVTREDLMSLYQWAHAHDAAPVSFSFAGWTPEAYDVAVELNIPLIRFTFAGNIEPNNDAARAMARLREGLTSVIQRKRS